MVIQEVCRAGFYLPQKISAGRSTPDKADGRKAGLPRRTVAMTGCGLSLRTSFLK